MGNYIYFGEPGALPFSSPGWIGEINADKLIVFNSTYSFPGVRDVDDERTGSGVEETAVPGTGASDTDSSGQEDSGELGGTGGEIWGEEGGETPEPTAGSEPDTGGVGETDAETETEPETETESDSETETEPETESETGTEPVVDGYGGGGTPLSDGASVSDYSEVLNVIYAEEQSVNSNLESVHGDLQVVCCFVVVFLVVLLLHYSYRFFKIFF
jgi:hypothetical protein